MRAWAGTLVAVAVVVLAVACGRGTRPEQVPGGNAETGKRLIDHFGCGACHVIGGIQNADGRVGPNLTNWVDRHTVGGVLPNTPQNVERWLRNPPAVSPRTTMPDLGVTDRQARDIAAYLYGQ